MSWLGQIAKSLFIFLLFFFYFSFILVSKDRTHGIAGWIGACGTLQIELNSKRLSWNDIFVMEWHWVVLETPFAGAFVSDIYI